jgi:hypothetical protein
MKNEETEIGFAERIRVNQRKLSCSCASRMSKTFQSANSMTRLCDVPSRSLRVESRDSCDIRRNGLTRAPGLDEAELRSRLSAMLNRQNCAPCSTILGSFMEGFAMYAASYHAAPQAIANSLVEPSPRDASAQEPERVSWRARRRTMAIVSASTHTAVMNLEEDTARAGLGSETASADAPLETDRPNRLNLLAKIWFIIASRWAYRRREIKETVTAATELDGAALQDTGIPNPYGIEQAASLQRAQTRAVSQLQL